MNSLFSYWHFDPCILLFIIGICFFYLFTVNFKLTRKALYLLASILIIIICMASPLHFLGMNYLFSAHMLSGVLILLIAGPLIVASLPAENKFQNSLKRFSEKIRKVPILAWLSGVVLMWFWHIPLIFNQLFASGHMQSGMHLMSGLIYMHFATMLFAGMFLVGPFLRGIALAVSGHFPAFFIFPRPVYFALCSV